MLLKERSVFHDVHYTAIPQLPHPAANNALLLEAEEHSIIASGRYSIEDVLYGRFYWYTKFLCRYEAIYGKNGSMEQAQFKIIEA